MGGQSVSFEFRTEDPRIGRFLSTDPLTAMTPWETPYAFAGNSPILNIDWLGLKRVDSQKSRSCSNGMDGTRGGKSGKLSKSDRKAARERIKENKKSDKGNDNGDPIPGFKEHKIGGSTLHLPDNAIIGKFDNVDASEFFWVAGEFYFADKNGGYSSGNKKWLNPSISYTSGGLNQGNSVLDVTFSVGGLPPDTKLQVIQIVQLSEMDFRGEKVAKENGVKVEDGFIIGSYMFTEGDKIMSGHVDGGRDSYWAQSYKKNTKVPNGMVHPTKPYYNDNASLRTIRVYDHPSIQNVVNIVRFTTIIIAVNYNNSGKDLIIGSFNWGFDGFNIYPKLSGEWVSPISLSKEKVGDTDMQILNHYYKEYSFFKF